MPYIRIGIAKKLWLLVGNEDCNNEVHKHGSECRYCTFVHIAGYLYYLRKKYIQEYSVQ